MRTASTWSTMVTSAKRRHMVTRSPSVVIRTIGFVVIHTNADTVVVSVSAGRYNAARQEDRQAPDSKCEY